MFWSNAHCHQQKSLIERMVTVPDNMPFTQQVQLAEQNRAQAAALSQPPAQVVQSAPTNPQADRQAECKALDAAIANYDAQARQPQTGYQQDWLASQKRKARDRQFQMKC